MNIVTKIVTFPFTLITTSLKKSKKFLKICALDFKYKTHKVYILLLIISYLGFYSYISENNFYHEYIRQAEAKVHTSGESMQTVNDIPKLQTTPGTEAWIKEQWQTRTNAKWENIYAVIQGESGWNSDAWNCNNNGSLDLGLYQGNSIHKELTPSCALNTVCATNWAIELYNEQGLTPWVAAKKLGLTK